MKLDNYFATFDLGSSVITGAIGERKSDNTIVIHAIEREPSEGAIRRGVIHNLDDVTHKVRRIVKKLTEKVQPEFARVYIGVGGQSLKTTNSSLSQFLTGTIDEEKLLHLRKESMNRQVDGVGVLGVYDYAYKVDGSSVRNPLGMSGSQIEVEHKVVTCRESNINTVKKCFEAKLDLEISKLVPSQKAAATAVLTDEDITRGCVLLDFGGGTTSVSIFRNKVLCHMSVIPFGGNMITRDITSLHFSVNDAENLKITQGSAFLDESLDTGALKQIVAKASDGSSIEMQRLHHVIEARLEEIVLNIGAQIDASGFTRGDLQSGVVVIGSGAMLKNLTQYLTTKLKMEVRRGTLPKMVMATPDAGDLSGISVVAGLMMLATENCAIVEEEPIVIPIPEPEPVIEQPEQEPESFEIVIEEPIVEVEPEVIVEVKEIPPIPVPPKPKEKTFFEKISDNFVDIFTPN